MTLSEQLSAIFSDGVGRNWRQVLASHGLQIGTRQALWDAMHPHLLSCPVCGAACPPKQTNTGRLTTCGSPSCRNQLKLKKTQRTNLRRYGTASAIASCVVKQKIQNTNQERYGGHPTKVASVQDKRKATNLQRYGAITPATAPNKVAASVQKRRLAEITRYRDTVFPRRQQAWLEAYEVEVLSDWESKKPLTFRHLPCGTIWTASHTDGIPRCPGCGTSKEQRLVEQVLRCCGISFKRNDRKIIAPLELDVLLPEHKVAFEVNGWYWHCDGKSTPMVEKTRLAQNAGIRLYHIMDWECNEHPEKVRSLILHAVGRTTRRLNARSLTLEVITAAEARAFLDSTHLAGFHPAKHHIGLRSSTGLEAVLSVGRPRWGKEDLEIIRWATALNTSVRGGFSRCLKNALAITGAQTVVSFCDVRTGSGGVYRATGFTLQRTTKPGYTWHKGRRRLTRYQTQKHLLSKVLGEQYDPSLSEEENMLAAGWSKVSDCGHQRWVFRTPETASCQLPPVAC